jgi:cell division septation protein DedD
MARGPSPREDAGRRGQRGRGGHGWDDADAPWLEEAEFEDGPIHTLVGRRTLWGILAMLAVLTIGVVVGIMLVSKRDSGPIDVPGVGETVPVLASPGPWKIEPTGPDVEGIPVEGQGDLRFGTGVGRETEAQIAFDSLPEDPLPRPVLAEEEAMAAAPAPGTPQPETAVAAPAPAPPRAVVPKPVDTVVPREAPRPVQPKIIFAPEPEPKQAAPSAGGTMLQLGAFSSEARARAAFKSMSERFGYLDGLTPLIIPVLSDGKTLYRLRTSAGSPGQARDICGRLRVAGEACTIVE